MQLNQINLNPAIYLKHHVPEQTNQGCKIEAENRKLISAIFSKVSVDTYQNLTFTPEQERQIQNSVCLTTEQAKEICSTTMNQSADLRWYSERSKKDNCISIWTSYQQKIDHSSNISNTVNYTEKKPCYIANGSTITVGS